MCQGTAEAVPLCRKKRGLQPLRESIFIPSIDPARKQWHRIPTHFRKKRGNGWGILTVFSCRINKAESV
jgi:hypothetical protein